MKKILASFLILAGLSFANTAAAQAKYIEGKDYKVLKTPIPAFKSGKKEVVEFFWFGCPHCYHLEGPLHEWLKNDKPEDTTFYSVPAPGGSWEFAAHAKYTADKLALDKSFRSKYFDEYMVKGNRGVIFSRKYFDQFLISNFKVKQEDIDKAWDSFEVKNSLERAKKLQEISGVTGVPSLIVNGKYLVSPNMVKNEKEMFDVINFLLATTDAEK